MAIAFFFCNKHGWLVKKGHPPICKQNYPRDGHDLMLFIANVDGLQKRVLGGHTPSICKQNDPHSLSLLRMRKNLFHPKHGYGFKKNGGGACSFVPLEPRIPRTTFKSMAFILMIGDGVNTTSSIAYMRIA